MFDQVCVQQVGAYKRCIITRSLAKFLLSSSVKLGNLCESFTRIVSEVGSSGALTNQTHWAVMKSFVCLYLGLSGRCILNASLITLGKGQKSFLGMYFIAPFLNFYNFQIRSGQWETGLHLVTYRYLCSKQFMIIINLFI